MTVPSEDALIDGVAAHFDVPTAVALSWLTQFAQRFNPKAASERLMNYEAAAASARQAAAKAAGQVNRSPSW